MEIYVEMLSLHFKHYWKYTTSTLRLLSLVHMKMQVCFYSHFILIRFYIINSLLYLYTIDSPPPLETLHIPSGFLSLPNWALQHYSFS